MRVYPFLIPPEFNEIWYPIEQLLGYQISLTSYKKWQEGEQLNASVPFQTVDHNLITKKLKLTVSA